MLFRSFLKSDYLGLDFNHFFLRKAISKGIRVKYFDLHKDTIPEADYVVLQRSLYQFENPDAVIRKMLSSASKQVIISESVQNFESTLIGRVLKPFIPLIVGTHGKNKAFRYTEKSFRSLMDNYNANYISTKGNRDLIAVINK